MIYLFNVRQSMRCFTDISAINRENKAQYSSIIICITFAQHVRSLCLKLECLMQYVAKSLDYGGPSLSLHFTTWKLKCTWYFAFKWNFICSLSFNFKFNFKQKLNFYCICYFNPLTPRAFCEKGVSWTFWWFLGWISVKLPLIWSKMHLPHNKLAFLLLALRFATF